MARRLHLLLLALFLFASIADAQAPAARAENAAPISLGRSVVQLYGPWKFTVGDSPIDPATGAPVWAEAAFDDSGWETVDLTPADGSIDPIVGWGGYVPGWTAKGHPGYWGYGWYRIRVRLRAEPGEKLALTGPADVDDAYQSFANGHLVGAFGDFSGSPPIVYYEQPMIFALPGEVLKADGSEVLVLAFRVWMQPNSMLNDAQAGGMHSTPTVGDAATVEANYRLQWLQLIRGTAVRPVEAVLFLLLAAVSFGLIPFDRSDQVYLWMGALFLVAGACYGLMGVATLSQWMSVRTSNVLIGMILYPISVAGWVMVWWEWFQLRRHRWIPVAALVLTLAYVAVYGLGQDMFFTMIPHAAAAAFHILYIVVRLVFAALLLWIVYLGIRERGKEGWLALPAVLMIGIGLFQDELLLMHIRVIWFPYGVQVSVGDYASLLLVAGLSVLLVRRLLNSVRRQRLLAMDVKQAQEVQQVILPEAQVSYAGFTIESVYRPAREVGGDFFQIIPHATDGSLLIVAGDVAGKGLQAGMLVALLVGAIRTVARFNPDPVVVLEELTQRLMGRGDAAATCLAMRIDADGAVVLANAGHVPPYLNGEPVAMEGALPLGIFDGAEFSVMHFQLEESDRLVLMSDGIVEATDAEGQLFGFERMNELLRLPSSAAGVADAAQRFGQEDDISVISVTRTAVAEAALA